MEKDQKNRDLSIRRNYITIVKTKYGETISSIDNLQIKFNTPIVSHNESLINGIRREQNINKRKG